MPPVAFSSVPQVRERATAKLVSGLNALLVLARLTVKIISCSVCFTGRRQDAFVRIPAQRHLRRPSLFTRSQRNGNLRPITDIMSTHVDDALYGPVVLSC